MRMKVRLDSSRQQSPLRKKKSSLCISQTLRQFSWSWLLHRTLPQRLVCWMRTQKRDGRAGSASGQTSMRRLLPTSTAQMCRHCSSFTDQPVPPSQRAKVVPRHLLQPHRYMPQWILWTPSTALSWPVTTRFWAHRCRSVIDFKKCWRTSQSVW